MPTLDLQHFENIYTIPVKYHHRMMSYHMLQAVIEASIIAPLVNLLQNAEFDIRKEAAWAISNATSGGSHEQIKYETNLVVSYSLSFEVCLTCRFYISLLVTGI